MEGEGEQEESNYKKEDEMDWRGKEVLSPIRDQSGYWCCWAYVTCGAIQSKHIIEHGSSIELSPQDLVNSIDPPLKLDPKTGLSVSIPIQKETGHFMLPLYPTFCHILKKGVRYHDACPGTGNRTPTTPPNETERAFRIKDVNLISCDETTLRNAVRTCPTPVGFKMTIASQMILRNWIDIDDIFVPEPLTGTETSADFVSEALLVVGFGFDSAKKIHFWRVMNTLGTDWGIDGVGRICMESDLPKGTYLKLYGACTFELLPKEECCQTPLEQPIANDS